MSREGRASGQNTLHAYAYKMELIELLKKFIVGPIFNLAYSITLVAYVANLTLFLKMG